MIRTNGSESVAKCYGNRKIIREERPGVKDFKFSNELAVGCYEVTSMAIAVRCYEVTSMAIAVRCYEVTSMAIAVRCYEVTSMAIAVRNWLSDVMK